MNLFILRRRDNTKWNDCDEQTILAKNEEEALRLAENEDGIWYIFDVVNMSEPRVLTKSFDPYY